MVNLLVFWDSLFLALQAANPSIYSPSLYSGENLADAVIDLGYAALLYGLMLESAWIVIRVL